MKRFLTVFLPAEQVHLHKDVGMIPYAMAACNGYEAALLYMSQNEIREEMYETRVKLLRLAWSVCFLVRWWRIFWFVLRQGQVYDVVNVYHLSLKKMGIPLLFKCLHPRCKIYLKLDLDEMNFANFFAHDMKHCLLNFFKGIFVRFCVDYLSVETKQYYQALKELPVFHGRLLYVPDGVQLDEAEPTVKEKLILTVGRIGTRQKNSELLLQAVCVLPPVLLQGWHVCFAGPMTDDFREYAAGILEKRPDLQDVFVFTGNIESKPRLYALYAKARIFCLTSRWESFGLVLPEAMSFADFVISTDFAAAHDLLDEGRIGHVFASEDLAGLKRELVWAMTHEAECLAMGRQGQEWIKEHFQWDKIAAGLEKRLFEETDA